MADLRIPDLDEATVRRLKRRAKREGRSVHDVLRDIVRTAVREEQAGAEASPTLRMSPAHRAFRDITPVEAEGIPASELLTQNHRRR